MHIPLLDSLDNMNGYDTIMPCPTFLVPRNGVGALEVLNLAQSKKKIIIIIIEVNVKPFPSNIIFYK